MDLLSPIKKEILKELEYKLHSLMKAGGTVFGLDYRIPNGTPLENYKFQVDTAREILNLLSRDGKRRGWVSQAFYYFFRFKKDFSA